MGRRDQVPKVSVPNIVLLLFDLLGVHATLSDDELTPEQKQEALDGWKTLANPMKGQVGRLDQKIRKRNHQEEQDEQTKQG